MYSRSYCFSMNYFEQGTRIALFPDTVSIRAQRHVQDLMNVVKKGDAAALVFLIQRGDCTAFAPSYEKDPEYSALVAEAAVAGVKMVALVCDLESSQSVDGGGGGGEYRVVFKGSVPVQLDYKSN